MPTRHLVFAHYISRDVESDANIGRSIHWQCPKFENMFAVVCFHIFVRAIKSVEITT